MKNKFIQTMFNWSKRKWIYEINHNFPFLTCYENWIGKHVANKINMLPKNDQLNFAFELLKKQSLRLNIIQDAEIGNVNTTFTESLADEIVQKQIILQEECKKYKQFNAIKIADLMRTLLPLEFTEQIDFLGSKTSWRSITSFGEWKVLTVFEVYGNRRSISYMHSVQHNEITLKDAISVLGWYGIGNTRFFVENESDVDKAIAAVSKCSKLFVDEFVDIIGDCTTS